MWVDTHFRLEPHLPKRQHLRRFEGWLCVSLWAMWRHSEFHLPADIGKLEVISRMYTPVSPNVLWPDFLSFQAEVGHSVHQNLNTPIQDAAIFTATFPNISMQQIPMLVTLPGPAIIRYSHGRKTNGDHGEVP